MKIALCLSGQPRSVERTFPFIRDNILINNPDVFVHSWIDDNIKGKRPIAACGAVASDAVPHNIDEVILDLYKPKAFIFEPQIEFDEKNYNTRKAMFIRPKNSISQRYSVWRSFQLANIHGPYDVVIRMRFDWGIKISMNIEHLNFSGVIAPNDCPHHGGINDQFAIGSMHHMFHYAELYHHLDTHFNAGLPFVDEILLGHHLRASGVPIIPTNIPYEIIRHSGDPNERHGADYVEAV